jgi:hypothetical protein
MSDPHGTPGVRRPPRAEPLQPDRPGRGDDRQPAGDNAGDASADSQEHLEKMRRQSDQAIDNTSTGYD